jgi:hypothetical protein
MFNEARRDEMKPMLKEVTCKPVRRFLRSGWLAYNLRLFETQTGGMLVNSQFVRNPYLVSREQVVPWPAPNGEILKLAFPARIHPRTKGHDLLIDVLSEYRWRARPVEVSFFGEGLGKIRFTPTLVSVL